MATRTPAKKPTPLQSQHAEVTAPVADDGSREVEFDGEIYTVPAQEDVDIEAVAAFESSQVVTGIRLLLGEEQYAKFRKNHKTMGQLNEFLSVLMNVGNS